MARPLDAQLLALIGTWHTENTGRVVCPTGIALPYGEQFTISRARDGDGWLHYEHRAWRFIDDGGAHGGGETLHAEYGFIRPLGARGQIEVTLVMNSGRGESARGTIAGDDRSIRLKLLSERFINDRRGVLSTRREYTFDGLGTAACTCAKSMELQTDTAWPQSRMHLQATLRQVLK